ncbi:hypothetical protein DIPPA_22105 [Diplonema papillatum]|nr:hypothetical protein DIPPA_22105 [Diplonema papillatum]
MGICGGKHGAADGPPAAAEAAGDSRTTIPVVRQASGRVPRTDSAASNRAPETVDNPTTSKKAGTAIRTPAAAPPSASIQAADDSPKTPEPTPSPPPRVPVINPVAKMQTPSPVQPANSAGTPPPAPPPQPRIARDTASTRAKRREKVATGRKPAAADPAVDPVEQPPTARPAVRTPAPPPPPPGAAAVQVNPQPKSPPTPARGTVPIKTPSGRNPKPGALPLSPVFPGSSPPDRRCRRGHAMVFGASAHADYSDGWRCDECGAARGAAEKHWLCGICRFDACGSCARASPQGRPAAPGPDPYNLPGLPTPDVPPGLGQPFVDRPAFCHVHPAPQSFYPAASPPRSPVLARKFTEEVFRPSFAGAAARGNPIDSWFSHAFGPEPTGTRPRGTSSLDEQLYQRRGAGMVSPIPPGDAPPGLPVKLLPTTGPGGAVSLGGGARSVSPPPPPLAVGGGALPRRWKSAGAAGELYGRRTPGQVYPGEVAAAMAARGPSPYSRSPSPLSDGGVMALSGSVSPRRPAHAAPPPPPLFSDGSQGSSPRSVRVRGVIRVHRSPSRA